MTFVTSRKKDLLPVQVTGNDILHSSVIPLSPTGQAEVRFITEHAFVKGQDNIYDVLRIMNIIRSSLGLCAPYEYEENANFVRNGLLGTYGIFKSFIEDRLSIEMINCFLVKTGNETLAQVTHTGDVVHFLTENCALLPNGNNKEFTLNIKQEIVVESNYIDMVFDNHEKKTEGNTVASLRKLKDMDKCEDIRRCLAIRSYNANELKLNSFYCEHILDNDMTCIVITMFTSEHYGYELVRSYILDNFYGGISHKKVKCLLPWKDVPLEVTWNDEEEEFQIDMLNKTLINWCSKNVRDKADKAITMKII